jgi:hypothetical protein
MSIFKSTLKPEIAAQLKARETIVSSDTRSDDFLRYTSGKNSWVRMTSFVNYDDPKGKYKGDQLSRKYVLEGGTLYNNKNNNLYSLRSGVGKLDGVYASNLDFNNAANKSDVQSGLGADRPFGLRPMPGIVSANVINKSAYGSLREATIQFYAWDKHQLEELELLFMRTGYTVFLEWGWSQYIDHDAAGAKGINSAPTNIKVKNFDTITFNPFSTSIKEDVIYEKIDNSVSSTKGNYDAMLGFVKNFSWQLMPNGGFQCTTTLISRGETIDSIKASANPYTVLGSDPDPQIQSGLTQPQPVYSLFEKIFLNLIAHVNEGEFVSGYTYDGINLTGSLNIPGATQAQKVQLQQQAEDVFNKINGEIANTEFRAVNGDGKIYNKKIDNLSSRLFLKFCDGDTEGVGIEYISMNAFLAILNKFFLIKDKSTKDPVVTILLMDEVPCLASEDSVSIDPSTCLINNPLATLVCDLSSGFVPDIYSHNELSSGSPIVTGTTLDAGSNFLISGTSIGAIDHIFIGMNHIIQRYRGLSGGPNGVDVITLLQAILDDISFALGGINDFKLYNSRNTVQIIDVKYFGNEKKDSKFKFDLIGLKSICRDVKINSRIFSEQSTMMAIGATSANPGKNLGDIYSSTQAYFNKGLTDRVLTTEFNTVDPKTITATAPDGTVVSGPQFYYVSLYNQIVALATYLQRNVLGTLNNSANFHVTKLPSQADVINAGSLLKTMHYQINGKDVDFKSLIPFELEITLDGIGGLVVGQIFTIDKSILPKDYYNKNLGFIITGISQALQNNDWTTVIKTQICLLENENIAAKYSNPVDRTKLKGIIANLKTSSSAVGLLLSALADFMVHQMFVYFILDRDASYKASSNLSYAYFLGNIVDDPNWIKLIGTSTTKPPPIYPPSVFAGNYYPSVLVDDPYKYARRGFSTINTVDKIDEYLKSWFAVQQKNPINASDPYFPADYNAFITAGGTTNFNVANFKNLLVGGADIANATDMGATPATLTDAWSKIWIGKLGPYNLPILTAGEILSGGASKQTKKVPFVVESVYTSADQSYLTTADQNQYLNGTAGDIRKIAVNPYELGLVTNPAPGAPVSVPSTYAYDYTRLQPGAFADAFTKFFNFVQANASQLGITSAISLPVGFIPTKYQLENVK